MKPNLRRVTRNLAIALAALTLFECAGPTAPDEGHFVIADRDAGTAPTAAMLDEAEALWSRVTSCVGRKPELRGFPVYLRGAVFTCGAYPGASGCFYGNSIDAVASGFGWVMNHELTHLADPALRHQDPLFQKCAGTPPPLAAPTPLPSLCSSTGHALPPCPTP